MIERIPCQDKIKDNCPIYELEGECYEDKHHIYWPASDYSGRIDKQFRQLEVNKVVICRWLHNTIHTVALPPEHPTATEMRKVINE